MAELQVSGEVDGLVACNERNRLEEDIRYGPSWKHVASDKLVHHLCWDLLIGDGLKHGKRDGKNER